MGIHNFLTKSLVKIEWRAHSSITQIFSCRQFNVSEMFAKTDFWGILSKENLARGGWGCILYVRNFKRGGGLKKYLKNGKYQGVGDPM